MFIFFTSSFLFLVEEEMFHCLEAIKGKKLQCRALPETSGFRRFKVNFTEALQRCPRCLRCSGLFTTMIEDDQS